ncbi:hypothetical protein PHSY_006138 [Pseudozyma hubeiensis SY62]|uniref:Uncharacterized protein n=1 Tax=Pseudozyma hubeiensis (strain SY62) TaxID=1305764 RepID=R9PB18_PSEHS|nr:hypothetical protein PHSY_006138 [Pseudozyma hubeiensis SY62]GAC98544.1 hypothetical protein PHSY_006138 [Pseudozyma hubeiensis SY62]
MLFDEAHTEELKAWLTSELGPICDADPEVLADYVLALLKHEGPQAELQTLLTEQLEDFLAAETEPFVTKTFQAIADKAYLPSSGSAEADHTADSNALASTSDLAADTSTSSRKRRADDDTRDSTRSPPRQTRRLQDSTATPGSDDSRAGRARERDSRERAANTDGTDANGAQTEGGRRDNRPKQLCRDYHNKGFCPRGASCKFEHSTDMQPANANARNQQSQSQRQQPPFHLSGMMGPGGPNAMHGPPMMFPGAPFGMPPQGWHPSMGPPPGMAPGNAGPGASPSHLNGDGQNLANRMGGQLAPQASDANHFSQAAPFNGGMGPGGRGGAMGGRGRGRGGGPPGTFQSARRSNTTLVIENVPADSLDLIKVNEYFKKFGTITNISIDKPGSKALVSYSQPAEAKEAHESPDVIFGNRFVKVYFQRLDEAAGGAPGAGPTPRPPPSSAPQRGGFVPGKTSNVYHARPPVAGASTPGGGPAAHVGGMSEERKKLLEDQRTKQAALDSQLAEQKALLAKFGDKSLTAEDKKQTMTQLKQLGDQIKTSTEAVKAAVEALQAAPKEAPSSSAAAAGGAGGDVEAGRRKAEKEKREKEQLDRELDLHAQGSSPGSTTEELKKKLESLKAEAASLGIDGANAGAGYGYNGRGRGRGGYVPRGRGGYTPYAARGGPGGMGGGPNRSFRIDNRTTRLKIEDLPAGADAEKLKQHFAAFGELDSFDADAATVVYKARNSAEQALRGGAEIPDVGIVKLSWIQPPVAAAAAPAATTAGVEGASTGDKPAATEGGDEEYDDDRDSSWKR